MVPPTQKKPSSNFGVEGGSQWRKCSLTPKACAKYEVEAQNKMAGDFCQFKSFLSM